ncbi:MULTISPECIES: hypothetical protein [unclassified Polaribacter]|uniref:hypothetical protein n=1 Tax=unclassified Polaribacter TaxID=196858 RepID=UPI0011BD7BC3|nr:MULTISPECIES: hypothetical protein [unclassified Polaribacter]TXD48995.1 hypothetical protein ES043_17545 [Polaribacter sp. IC063]TXD56019.1 hypothetical protein ES044_17470 [Polaribacter sp. IC066]
MNYIKNNGVIGTKRQTRYIDGYITYKLALHQNLKVTNIDDQQTNGLYHEAWTKCAKEGTKNGNNLNNATLNKKQYNSAMIPPIFRSLATHTSKRKTMN